MLLFVLQVDQDVIYVNNDTLIQQFTKHFVNHCLERGRGIAQPKRHNQVLEKTVFCPESSLPLVALGNPNEVVTVAQIQLREDLCFGHLLSQFCHQRQGSSILHREFVETAEVHTQAERPIGLWNEQ